MYQTCSFRATITQKSNYIISHYATSGFGWTYLYHILRIGRHISRKTITVATLLLETPEKVCFRYEFDGICKVLNII